MKKYKINKGQIAQNLDKKLIIFDPNESILYSFNEVAGDIFKKLKLNWNNSQIIGHIVNKYKIKEKIAKKDFREFINSLKKRKIISAEKTKK